VEAENLHLCIHALVGCQVEDQVAIVCRSKNSAGLFGAPHLREQSDK
jgi:hypothetical protein